MSRNPREIIRDGNVAILPQSQSTFEIVGSTNPRDNYFTTDRNIPEYVERNWLEDCIQVGEFKIVPNGNDNLFPQNFKDLIDSNNIFHSILREKIDLLLCGGVNQYKRIVTDGKPKIEEVFDKEIDNWLKTWDFDNWLLEQVTDFIYVENNASLFITNKARRIPGYENRAKIKEIEYLPIEDIRMSPYDDRRKIPFYYSANWYKPFDKGIMRYAAYDRRDPFKNAGSVFFVKMPSFGSKYYGRPPFIGIANYLRLKTLIINWSIDNLKNTQFKFHVESPFEYWEAVRKSNGWNEKQLSDYESEFMAKVDTFLSSQSGENAAKRFHSKFLIDEGSRQPLGWKINVLQDNTEKNSKAYIEASEQIDQAIIASAHLDPSLSNIQIKGNLSSGLDKLIAFNVHQLVSTPTPRRLVLGPVNEAIRVNWPDKDIFLAFPETQLEYQQKAITNTKSKEEESDDN